MTFKIGMPVKCVDASGMEIWLRTGATYTVAAISHEFLNFEELIKPGRDLRFYKWRFRPTVSPKQQVSFTTGAPRDSRKWDNRKKRVEVVS